MKKNKKYMVLLITALIMSLFQVSVNAETNVIEGNLFIHSTSNDLAVNAADLENVEISNNIGDGAIVLKSDKLKGIYTSNIINTSPFENLVLSWDSDTPEGTSIQVEARVFAKTLDSNGLWTEKWSNFFTINSTQSVMMFQGDYKKF